MAKSNLLVRGGADFSGLKKELEKTQKNLNNFQSSVSKNMTKVEKTMSSTQSALSSTMKKIGVILGSLAIGKLIKDSTELAIGVESAVNQINRTMGTSAGAFQKWVNGQASAYGMAKSEALKYGAVYSNLISGFAKDTAETTKYTEELLKASAVVASATGRTMEDTMERIRSGMLGSTEAIEDLGINVNVAMIESTNAFKQFANGKSWQQLDFQTQQQIRLMAILEQANKKYGDTLANTTATQMQMFRAELNNVKLSLGQAFMPILNTVLPLLTALASKLAYVMNIVSQFTQALFGKPAQAQAQATAISQQASAANDLGDSLKSAGKEAKKAKGALAGFDEINNLSMSSGDSGSSGGGSGAGGGASIPAIDTGGFIDSTIQVSEKVQEMADKVKQILSSLATFFTQNKEIIVSAIAGIIAGFAAFQIITNWTNIIAAFKDAFVALSAAIGGISWPVVAVAAAIALLVANLVYLWQTNEGFRNSVIEVWNQIKTFVVTVVNDLWTIVKDIWDKYGKDLMDNLAGFMKSIQDIILNVWENFLKPLVQGALEMLSWLWDKHLKGLVKQVGEFIMKLVNGALEIWNKFISPIVNWLIQTLGPVFSGVFKTIINVFGTVVGAVADVAKGIFKALGGIIDFIVGVFTGNWKKAWEGVKGIFKGVFDALVGIVKFPLNLIIDVINAVIGGLNKLNIKIPDWVPGFGGKSFGFNIPKIPKLANGGYIGANSPVLAMIGDNRNEGEIVAPESKIYEQTYKAIKDALGSEDKRLVLNFNIGNSTIARVVIDSLSEYARQHGEIPIPI